MNPISEFLEGKTLFITGATGFLAKGLVEKLLRQAPGIRRIYLLIRSSRQTDGRIVTAEQRLKRDIIDSSAFSALRALYKDDYEDFVADKLVPVTGDLTCERLGIGVETYDQLCREVDIIINSAATVVFDERVDLALDMNTLGPRRVLGLAQDCHDAVFAHVSTAYVNGEQIGELPERLLSPTQCIANITRNGAGPEYDLDNEIARIQALRDQVLAEAGSTDLTQKFTKMLDRQDAGKRVTEHRREHQLDALRQRWITKRLVNEGIARARELGWHDNYTYTKAMGEQLLVRDHGNVPLVIVRPSIIESSLYEPEPGWLDGLKVADPLIAHFGKGRLPDFPGNPSSILDVIPVDMVVNVIIGALPEARNGNDVKVFHVATSAENPLTFGRIVDLTYDYFKRYPMRDRHGEPIPVRPWHFPRISAFRLRYYLRYRLPVTVMSWAIQHLRFINWSSRLKRRISTLDALSERVLSLVDIYSPYTNLHCTYGIANTRALFRNLSPEDRESLRFDVSQIDWREYLQDIHLPGLKRHVLKMPGEQKTSNEHTEEV